MRIESKSICKWWMLVIINNIEMRMWILLGNRYISCILVKCREWNVRRIFSKLFSIWNSFCVPCFQWMAFCLPLKATVPGRFSRMHTICFKCLISMLCSRGQYHFIGKSLVLSSSLSFYIGHFIYSFYLRFNILWLLFEMFLEVGLSIFWAALK